jgi:4-amino-4-deoxy-L-arabinose transferase-like glycosyltransferase
MQRDIPAIIRETALRDGALWIALALAFAGKIALLAAGAFPFNADEAVVTLMARHMLRGEVPLLFYGQAYMGSLDAALGAAGFAIFGENVTVLRIVQTLLFLGTIWIWYRICARGFGSLSLARLTAFLLAVPPVLVTLYTTASLGGYGEALFFGSLCLLLVVEMYGGKTHPARWLLLGLAAGIGFWSFPLSVVFSGPALIAAVLIKRSTGNPPRGQRPIRGILLMTAGILLGALPWIAALLQLGLPALQELGGSAIAGSLQGSLPEVFGIRLLNLIIFGSTVLFGMRPPWAVQWLAPVLLPFALVVSLAAVAYGLFSLRRKDAMQGVRRMLAGSVLLFSLAYLLTPFGNDPSGRYFLPLYPMYATCCAAMIIRLARQYGRRMLALALIPIAFHAAGNVECALRNPPGITTQFDAVAQVDMRGMQPVLEFLLRQGETRGYTNYWVSFPLAFLSQERLIFTARLPYHEDLRYTPRDDRYPPYDLVVAQSERIAYITTRNPALDRLLEKTFASLGVEYRLEQIGDFRIYYSLSRVVRPDALNLQP